MLRHIGSRDESYLEEATCRDKQNGNDRIPEYTSIVWRDYVDTFFR